MAEIYIDQTSPIKTKIYWAGEIVDADDDIVTARVYDITRDLTLDPLVNPDLPIVTLNASKLETDIGTYQVVIPFQYCNRNRKFKIVWSYEVSGNEASHVYYTDVVTPYANIAEVLDSLNIGTDPSDSNYKTYNELQMAEKYARKLIEEFTSQSFNLSTETHVVYGLGTDVLALPFRIEELYVLKENDVLLVDNLDETSNWLYTPIISESNFDIRVNRQSIMDNTVYTANGLVPPTITDGYYYGAFKQGSRYTVQGKFGWSSVPDNVEEACIVLMQQFFDKDTAWRNKYVKNVSAFDWRFEYTEDAYKGTGNLYADQLLSPYVLTAMMVI
jgi:hypothetical protein